MNPFMILNTPHPAVSFCCMSQIPPFLPGLLHQCNAFNPLDECLSYRKLSGTLMRISFHLFDYFIDNTRFSQGGQHPSCFYQVGKLTSGGIIRTFMSKRHDLLGLTTTNVLGGTGEHTRTRTHCPPLTFGFNTSYLRRGLIVGISATSV